MTAHVRSLYIQYLFNECFTVLASEMAHLIGICSCYFVMKQLIID